jgi:hypothetical protein
MDTVVGQAGGNMTKLMALVGAVALCAAFCPRADAVVFRANATSVGYYSAATVKFGHASQNKETPWSAPGFPGAYTAVAAVPFGSQRLDALFLSSLPYWAFGLQVWASPDWAGSDVAVRIWAEDVSYPGRGWWGAFRPDYITGPSGFSVAEVGSYGNPLITLTVPASAARNGVYILLNQNPEPSSVTVLLSGLGSLLALRVRRRRAAA